MLLRHPRLSWPGEGDYKSVAAVSKSFIVQTTRRSFDEIGFLQTLLRLVNQSIISFIRKLPALVPNLRRILVSPINRVRFRAQMRQHVMSATRGAFVPQRRNIYGCNDDSFARAGRCFRQHSAVVIHYLTAA